jgi:uncharacterized protein DUF4124
MIRIVVPVILLAFGTSAYSQVYKWTDKDGKVHYSDKPSPGAVEQPSAVNPSPVRPNSVEAEGRVATGRSEATREIGSPGKFRAEEEGALGVLCALAITEAFQCAPGLQRYCTLEEMIEGGPGGNPKGFEKDPRLDANYRYVVDVRGHDIAFSAVPLKPGLAGFFNPGDGTRYNPIGPASKDDKPVQGGVNCKGFAK